MIQTTYNAKIQHNKAQRNLFPTNSKPAEGKVENFTYPSITSKISKRSRYISMYNYPTR